MGFQTIINRQPGLAVEGDFADANVRANVLAPPSVPNQGPSGYPGAAGVVAMIAAPLALTSGLLPVIGYFAWLDQVTGYVQLSNNVPGGDGAAKIGFVGRQGNLANAAMLQQFLADDTLLVLPGREITLYDQGSFWGRFAGGATVGQKVFAGNGAAQLASAAAGAVVPGYIETNFYVDSPAGNGELAKFSTWG
jgi:hypothetical protein